MIKMHEFHRSETVVSLNLTTYGENLPEKVPNSRGKDPLFSIGVVAMILNIPYVTRSRLIRLLQQEGILTQNTFPYPRYVDAEWFELRAPWTDAGQGHTPRTTVSPSCASSTSKSRSLWMSGRAFSMQYVAISRSMVLRTVIPPARSVR